MITDLGGTFGLWIGLAFFSAFEFLEFVVDNIALIVAKWICGRRPVFTVAPLIKPKDFKRFFSCSALVRVIYKKPRKLAQKPTKDSKNRSNSLSKLAILFEGITNFEFQLCNYAMTAEMRSPFVNWYDQRPMLSKLLNGGNGS
jgi:hypothetical protein